MKKYKELKDPSSCLNKAGDDEMLFVLRAQDVTSPKTILYWITENFETCPPAKLREAFECAMSMRLSDERKKPD